MARQPGIPMSKLGRCRRQGAYHILRIPASDPIPPEALERMRKGTEAETEIVGELLGNGYVVREVLSEQRFVQLDLGGMLMRGRPDGFISSEETPWRLLEMKFINRKAWRKWKREGVSGFRPYYLDSAHGYMAATGVWEIQFEAASKLSSGVLELYQEIVKFDLEYWQDVVSRWKSIWGGVLEGKLPEPDFDGDSWVCSPQSCQWSSLCPSGKRYQNESAGIEIEEVIGKRG